MCERYSWIMIDGKAVFLTAHDVYHTKRGRELRKHTPSSDDWHGHGAIRWYEGIPNKKGVDRECTDFSSPRNFPPELALAIKDGKMWGFGITKKMVCMLRKSARAEYNKAYSTARAECEKACSTAYAKYNKACSTAWAKLWSDPKNRIRAWR